MAGIPPGREECVKPPEAGCQPAAGYQPAHPTTGAPGLQGRPHRTMVCPIYESAASRQVAFCLFFQPAVQTIPQVPFPLSRRSRSAMLFLRYWSLLLFRQIHTCAVVLRHDLRFRQSGFAFPSRPERPWGSRAYPCVDERACQLLFGSR